MDRTCLACAKIGVETIAANGIADPDAIRTSRTKAKIGHTMRHERTCAQIVMPHLEPARGREQCEVLSDIECLATPFLDQHELPRMLLRGLPFLALLCPLQMLVGSGAHSRDFIGLAGGSILHRGDELQDLGSDDAHRFGAAMIELARADRLIRSADKSFGAHVRQLKSELDEGIGREAQFLDAIAAELI